MEPLRKIRAAVLLRFGYGSVGRLGFCLVLVTIVVTSIWLQLHSVLHHDPAWLIHGTEVFLAGGKLYQDVFELNPPLIFYLTVPPVWLSTLYDIASVDTFILYVFFLIAISMSAVWALLRSLNLPPLARNGALLAAWLALAIYPAGNFGQREHLMLILSLPYLLLTVTRARQSNVGGLLAVGVGVLSTLGFGLKPHFLLVPFALELYLLIRSHDLRRCFRLETITLTAGILTYFGIIALFTPLYLTTIVPFGMSVYDVGFAAPLSSVLNRPGSMLLPLILVMHCVMRHRERVPEIGDVLAIAAVSFFIDYVVQMKGWSYQAYPYDTTLFMLLFFIFVIGLPQAPNLQRVPGVLTAVSGMLLAAMIGGAAAQRYTNSFMTRMAPIVSALPHGSAIYIFSAKVGDGFPLVNYYGVQWSSRFDTFWLLPGLIAQPSPSPRIERFLRDAVVDDLTKHPPKLIFVENSARKAYFRQSNFDYIKFFSADARFVKIWAGYDEIAPVGDFRLFVPHASGGSGT